MSREAYGSREEWLTGRGSSIGASEVSAVLGEGGYGSAYGVWFNKIDPTARRESTERMVWGIRHEPTVAAAAAEATGRDVRLANQHVSYRHDELKFLTATPDSWMKRTIEEFDLPSGPGPLQIKCVDYWQFKKTWIDGLPPRHIWIQNQIEMQCTGAEWGAIVALLSNNELIGPVDYLRDDAWFAEIEPKLREFWACVLERRAPEIDGSEVTSEALALQFPTAMPEAVSLPDELAPAAEECAQLREKIAELTKREKLLANRLIAAMGDASIGIFPATGKQVTYRNHGKGRRLKV